ncbi:hypothetical protein CRM22_011236 [Opisthorchis felineus]|uniref:Dynactin subunit 1 n=1 Tax=Opisthorchis felineus TaxID=147828 RepID=A0A4S2JX75_OPIFE|nr:hypothetical protein CRM22_011236 [Opisthorchis felineus]
MTEFKLKVGTRVEVIGKDSIGTVAFIGPTQFSTGKWVGVVLDEPKGKNNGTVQGKRYFTCDENFGIFVRPTQLKLLDGQNEASLMSSSVLSESSAISDTGSTQSGPKSAKPPSRSGSSSSLSSVNKVPTPAKGAQVKPSPLTRTIKPPTHSAGSRPAGDQAEDKVRVSYEQGLFDQPSASSSPSMQRRTPASGKPTEKPVPSPATKIPEAGPSKGVPQRQSPAASKPTTGTPPDIPKPSIPASPAPPIATGASGPQKISLPQPSSVASVPTSEMSTFSPSVSGGGKHSPDTELELTNLRAEIQTLTEQVEALRAKREEDRQRLQEMERMKIQFTQLEENRRLMREQAAELQRNLAQIKTEKAEVQEAFDRYREEMSDLVENMEMATLDKEMAEEKLDSLKSELEALKEQVEELTLENQILKEESEVKGSATGGGTEGGTGGPTPQQLKTLELQNERMKEALVKLRDLANQDKQEIAKLGKEVTVLESEVSQLTTEKERLSTELKQSLEQMIELKEQVDAALGADQMVDQLTQRNLELEEKLDRLTEERNDLEALCEMNDELQENARETERELREEIEQGRVKIGQLARHLDATRETVADYEKTLGKFRDLVTELQAQNADLRRSLADGQRQQQESVQQKSLTQVPPEALLSTTSLISQTKTMAKMIEAELRRMEAEFSTAHVQRLTAFLPDSFIRRGGDNDALLVLLLVDRLAAKSNLLATHLTERYPLPSCIPGQAKTQPVLTPSDTGSAGAGLDPARQADDIRLPGSAQPLPPMTKNKAEFYSFITCAVYLLRRWSALLAHYKQVLSGCSMELYLKLGSLYGEMAAHEQSIDRLLELCKKDQLDENTSLEPLLASISYFVQLRSVHLANEPVLDCYTKLLDFVSCVLAASDALATDSTALMLLTGQQLDSLEQAATEAAASVGGPMGITGDHQPTTTTMSSASSPGGLLGLLMDVIRFATVTRITARRVRRRLPKDRDTQPISFSSDVSTNLDRTVSLLTDIVAVLRETTRKSGRLTVRQVEDSGDLKPNTVFTECLVEAVKEQFSAGPSSSVQPDLSIRTYLGQVRELVAQVALAMENGEYDFDGTKQPKPQEPYTLRAIAYKQAQADLEGCRAKLEIKEEEVRELQMTIKSRANELSEMSVRLGLAEKRLENAGKGNEEKISRLEQRLEQMEAQQKRQEHEHEQTVDALQADLEALEQEKAELKEKLKSLSKKALLEGLIKMPIASGSPGSRQSPSPGSSDVQKGAQPQAAPSTPSSRGLGKDSAFMLSEIDALREALRGMMAENSRLRGEKMKISFAALTYISQQQPFGDILPLLADVYYSGPNSARIVLKRLSAM